jgi:uncharacterized protein (DUF1810 family)
VNDQYDLQRYVDAQSATYAQALAEIRTGQKRSHWMWFIFPQVRGLGLSDMAQRFAVTSLEEAAAYLAHPILGTRLVECTAALQDLPVTSAIQVFGEVDAIKLRSSLTLFAAAGGPAILSAALERWFGGSETQRR